MIRLASTQPDWVIGFEDETWWSRFELPRLSFWQDQEQTPKLIERVPKKDDPDPKALACYGLLAKCPADPLFTPRLLLRFVNGRPVSGITIQFLQSSCQKLATLCKRVLVLIWDNASWHISQAVRSWIKAHNKGVKSTRKGVRIILCYLPVKSPWLNCIEPHWTHAKKSIVEPKRTLTANQLAQRVCDYFKCEHEVHLALANYVA